MPAVGPGDSDLVEIEVSVRPGVDGLAERLWPVVLERARELARERGHDTATVDVVAYRADETKRALARKYGFEPSTSFSRMRIDFDGPVEPPAEPPGLTLHTGLSDEVRREAHRVQQEGFADHYGFVPSDYDLWFERRQQQSANDWSQLILARIDGRPAAMVHGNDQFVIDQQCGYVATLAVLPEFRGQGSASSCCAAPSPRTPPAAARARSCTWTPTTSPPRSACTSRRACGRS